MGFIEDVIEKISYEIGLRPMAKHDILMYANACIPLMIIQ